MSSRDLMLITNSKYSNYLKTSVKQDKTNILTKATLF